MLIFSFLSPYLALHAFVALWISFLCAIHSALSITLDWNLQLASRTFPLPSILAVVAILVLVVVGLMSLFSCWVPAENCFQFLELSWFLATWPLWTTQMIMLDYVPDFLFCDQTAFVFKWENWLFMPELTRWSSDFKVTQHLSVKFPWEEYQD